MLQQLATPFTILALTLACSFTGAETLDPEARRFPRTHISTKEWRIFLKETRAKRHARQADHERHTEIEVPQERAVYIFTRKTHPAHPAVIRSALIVSANKTYVHTSGYYAGDRQAFVAWVDVFLDNHRLLQK
jgi:hypothetical protein